MNGSDFIPNSQVLNPYTYNISFVQVSFMKKNNLKWMLENIRIILLRK